MDTLKNYGFELQSDAAPTAHVTRSSYEFAEFVAASQSVLPKLRPLVIDMAAKGELQGRWHPSGYMVFPVATHPMVGRLRLHIWPKGLRKAEVRPEGLPRDIHDHVMFISSLVVGGVFSDQIFAVSEAGSHGPYRVYAPTRGVAAATEILPTESVVFAQSLGRREVLQGQFHEINVGTFHVPTIPESQFASTLLISSHRVVDEGPRVLIPDLPLDTPITGKADLVQEMEYKVAIGQLLAAST